MYTLAAAPTGTKPEGEFLFEAMVGNGHHWEWGAGFDGHTTLFEGKQGLTVSLHGQATVTHLFKIRQKRTFDLVGKPLSRYMLAQKMCTPITDSLTGNSNATNATGAQAPSTQFKKEFAPVANLTTVPIDVKISAQAEVLLMLNLAAANWQIDIGYNYWARTCERLRRVPECEPLRTNMWALKGDAHAFGFVGEAVPAEALQDDDPVALSATQMNATVHAGTNFASIDVTDPAAIAAARRNPNVDNAQFAFAGNDQRLIAQPGADVNTDRIKTSINPVLLSADSIDCTNAKTRGSSSKLFTHISYAWKERTGWMPYLGLGAEVEWGHRRQSDTKECDLCTSQCLDCALSQWGVWVKGGISFK